MHCCNWEMHVTGFACFFLFNVLPSKLFLGAFVIHPKLKLNILHGNSGWSHLRSQMDSNWTNEATTALFSETNHQYVDRVRCFRRFYNVDINWSHPKRMFVIFGAFVAHASALTFRQWMCAMCARMNLQYTVSSGLSIPFTFHLF